MIKKALTLAALVAIALVLAPLPAVAEAGPVTVAPFTADMIGLGADSWIDRLTVKSSCDFEACEFQCNVGRNQCFQSGTSFAICIQLYEYCMDDCYENCT